MTGISPSETKTVGIRLAGSNDEELNVVAVAPPPFAAKDQAFVIMFANSSESVVILREAWEISTIDSASRNELPMGVLADNGTQVEQRFTFATHKIMGPGFYQEMFLNFVPHGWTVVDVNPKTGCKLIAAVLTKGITYRAVEHDAKAHVAIRTALCDYLSRSYLVDELTKFCEKLLGKDSNEKDSNEKESNKKEHSAEILVSGSSDEESFSGDSSGSVSKGKQKQGSSKARLQGKSKKNVIDEKKKRSKKRKRSIESSSEAESGRKKEKKKVKKTEKGDGE
jgi:hypothetical protein